MKNSTKASTAITFSLALIAAPAVLADQPAIDLETTKTSVAKSVLYGEPYRSTYAWGRHVVSTPSITPDSTTSADAMTANLDSGSDQLSDSMTISEAAYKWGIRSITQQNAYKWGIRSTQEQNAYKWGIRSTNQQAAYKWGIR